MPEKLSENLVSDRIRPERRPEGIIRDPTGELCWEKMNATVQNGSRLRSTSFQRYCLSDEKKGQLNVSMPQARINAGLSSFWGLYPQKSLCNFHIAIIKTPLVR